MLVQLPGPHATGWHFFEVAVGRLLADGLSMYRDHPELQFGPLSVVVAAPFVALQSLLGRPIVTGLLMVTLSALGLWVVATLHATAARCNVGLGERAAVTGALLVVIVWGDLAVRTTHIDDAIALSCLVFALSALVRERAAPAIVALAVAAAAKPWAIVFAPLVAALPGRWRWLRVVAVGALAVGTWVPFILAEPATLDTSRFVIENDPTSVLRALGFDDPVTPRWVRPTQLFGGLAIVSALVLARRWPAGVLAGIAWRLLLDPGAHRYYTIGFVVGALLLELRARPERIPAFSIAAAITLEVTAIPGFWPEPGQWLRLGVVAGGLVMAALSTTRSETADVSGR